jgi:hypothetical protein
MQNSGAPCLRRGSSFSACRGIVRHGLKAELSLVPVGSVVAGDVTSAWQDDGDTLLLRPQRFGGQPTIVANFQARQIGDGFAADWNFINVLANGRSQDASSKFAVRVQLFNFPAGAWQTAGQFEATTTETLFSLDAPEDVSPYVDGQQRIRTRLQIRRTAGNGRWEFEVEGFTLEGAGGAF